MTQEGLITLAKLSIYEILIATVLIAGVALVVGLAVSIFQATTQIQEQTLASVPKIVAVLVALIFFAPFLLTRLITFSANIFGNLHRFVG